jgi:hypothetical protein
VKNAPEAGGTTVEGITKAFRIKKAEWRVDKLELKVEGEGKFGDMVDVLDVATGAMLGKVAVNADGKWKLRLKNPVSVPRRIRAESNGSWKEREVVNTSLSASRLNNLFEKLVSAA